MNHKITIIVPVYNVEQWLLECIESILNQSYKNLEIILVDDGSTDGSGAICDSVGKQDARVRVFHKHNSGVADTRNYGLDIATGDYLIFIDSDDFVSNNMVEVLYNLCKENKCKLAQCGLSLFPPRTTEEYNVKITNNIAQEVVIYERKEMHWGLTGRGTARPMPWAKIFERSLFSNVRFPSGLIHEDEFAIHRILYNANCMAVTNEKLYFYRKTPDSIMNKKFSIKRYDMLAALQDRIEFYHNVGWDDLLFAAAQRYSVTTIELYRKTLESLSHEKEQLEYLINFYSKNWILLEKSPYLTHEIRQQHIEWLENPALGSLYSVPEYFRNLDNI